MEIKQCMNNKCVIVYHQDKSYLFLYGTLIMSRDHRKDKYWRHINNRELLSLTTIRHIHEFVGYDERFITKKSIRDQFMKLPYKEVA